MRATVPTVFVALVLTLAAALPAAAQPITVSNTSVQHNGYFAGGTDGTFQSNASFAHTALAGNYSFNLRGDVTAQFTGTATTFAHAGWVYATLTTGPAPVFLSNITLDYNGKEVPSGGSTADFAATNFYRAYLYVQGFGDDLHSDIFLPARTTQGVYIEDRSTALPETILAANTAYTLYMDVFPSLRLTSYPSSSSMLGYAVEYGGAVSPQFDGLTLSFHALAVPEPAGALLFGAGLALLALGRRRAARDKAVADRH